MTTPASQASCAALLPIDETSAPQPAEDPLRVDKTAESPVELADPVQASRTLIRQLSSGSATRAEADEAERALCALSLEQPASEDNHSVPAQQHRPEFPPCADLSIPKDAAPEAEKGMQGPGTPIVPVKSAKTRRVRIVDQPETLHAEDSVQAEQAQPEQATKDEVVTIAPNQTPASNSAAEAMSGTRQAPDEDETTASAKESMHSTVLPDEVANGHIEEGEACSSEAPKVQQMQPVMVSSGEAGQQQRSENPFFKLKAFDPELLELARQERNLSLGSSVDGAFQRDDEPLPDNPFFETQGPASSPDQLLRHATVFLLGGESPTATAADRGMIPMSRADTEPLCGQASGPGPGPTPDLAPKTPRLAPATSALPPAPAPTPHPAGAADLSPSAQFDISSTFLASQPSAALSPRMSAIDGPSTEDNDPGTPLPAANDSVAKRPTIALSAEAEHANKKFQEGKAAEGKGKDRLGDMAMSNSTRLPSWQPATPGQSMEALPADVMARQGRTRPETLRHAEVHCFALEKVGMLVILICFGQAATPALPARARHFTYAACIGMIITVLLASGVLLSESAEV